MAETDDDRIIQEAERLLSERTAMTIDELTAALRDRGIDPGPEEELAELLHDELSEDLIPAGDRRWAHLPTLLRNRIFTHRLTEAEVEHSVLQVNPDLEPLLIMDDEALHLTGGEPLLVAFPHHLRHAEERSVPVEALDEAGSLLLPLGALAALAAGDLVRLELTERGIDLQRVDQGDLTGDPGPVVERLREAGARPNPPHLLTDIAFSICVDLPESFRDPLPPLADLLSEAGLAWHGDWLAADDFDFDRHFTELQTDGLVQRQELTRDEAQALLVLLQLHKRLGKLIDAAVALRQGDEAAPQRIRHLSTTITEDVDERSIAAALPFLVEPWVAQAFLREALDYDDEGATALGLMVESLEEHSPRSIHPALRWLRAKAYERVGQILKAEECLRDAERLDPNWPPVLLDLARYEADRGDAARALALLRRAGEEEDPLLEEILTAFLPIPGPVVGRNDLCWCGSGRKFKQCHLHRPAARPLEERAAWLYQKAGRFLQDGPWLPLVNALVVERTAYAEDDEDADSDPDWFAVDVALFEGGAFAEFVEHRGVLLPADERLLADQWLLVQRSVFEVTEVRRGEGFSVTDLRSGDKHRVRDRAASRQLRPGMMICARIVPAGETKQVFGGIEPVSLGERDILMSLLDGDTDPEELVAFCSRRFAPPTLINTEGDPIVLCEMILSISDKSSLHAGLDQAYKRVDEEPPGWLVERTIEGMDRILAHLHMEGADLKISTNSERRLNDVLATIRKLDPGVTVISDEREALPDARAAAKLARQRPSVAGESGRPEDQAPEVQEALAAYIHDYEQKWLDLSIPALKGLTPRQAAEDPTRREDLLRLLASFEDKPDSPWAMSPNRLRAALGLPVAG